MSILSNIYKPNIPVNEALEVCGFKVGDQTSISICYELPSYSKRDHFPYTIYLNYYPDDTPKFILRVNQWPSRHSFNNVMDVVVCVEKIIKKLNGED